MLRACHFSLISNSTYELIRTGRTRGFFADVNMPPSLKCQIGQGRERGWLCWRRIKGVTPSHTFKALLVCLSDVREPLCLVEQLTCRLLFAARASIRSVGGKKGGCDRIRHIKWLTPGSGAKIVTCHFSCVNFYTSRLEFTHGFIFLAIEKPS